MKQACLIVFAVPLLLAALAGYPSAREEVDSMRCGSKLVQPGDTKIDVQAKCGEPALRDKIDATFAIEVKCYTAAAHYELGTATPLDQIEERWQLATAFYTMPTITQGAVVLYNPRAQHPLFVRKYSVSDLLVELEMIDKIRESYYEYIGKLTHGD